MSEEYAKRKEPSPEGYLKHLEYTREGYLQRDLERYLAGYSNEFTGVDLDRPDLAESLTDLERKMRGDLDEWELLRMDLDASAVHVAENVGHAFLEYESILRRGGDYLLDRRKNILVGKHDGNEWRILYKTTVYKDINSIDEDAAEELLDQKSLDP